MDVSFLPFLSGHIPNLVIMKATSRSHEGTGIGLALTKVHFIDTSHAFGS